MSLTPMQLELLQILQYQSDPMTGAEILQASSRDNETPHGIHQTASSLSRRGMVTKHPTYGRGSLSYSITPVGKNALKQAAKPRSGIKRSKPDGP